MSKSSWSEARWMTQSAFESEVEGIFEPVAGGVDRELRRESPFTVRHRVDPRKGTRANQNPQTVAARRLVRDAQPDSRDPDNRTTSSRRSVAALETRFVGRTVEELSIVEASLLIDQLKSLPASGDGDLTWTLIVGNKEGEAFSRAGLKIGTENVARCSSCLANSTPSDTFRLLWCGLRLGEMRQATASFTARWPQRPLAKRRLQDRSAQLGRDRGAGR